MEILGPNGHKVGRGWIELDSIDARKIIGIKSKQIDQLLGPKIRIE